MKRSQLLLTMLLSALLALPAMAQDDPRWNHFMALDMDGDGFLSADEYGRPGTAFEIKDLDSDGRLSREELFPPENQERQAEIEKLRAAKAKKLHQRNKGKRQGE